MEMKEILKVGMVVETINDGRALVIQDSLMFLDKTIFFEDLDSSDIIAIYDIRTDLEGGIMRFLNSSLSIEHFAIWKKCCSIDLSTFEKQFLIEVSLDYKYIARDKNGDLYLYSSKPCKRNRPSQKWDANESDKICRVPFTKHFDFVQWHDLEPYCIKDLLKEN